MRGKAVLISASSLFSRITPAYAGKRKQEKDCPVSMWDHPCVCGEKNNKSVRNPHRLGSPLRMRGKVRQ